MDTPNLNVIKSPNLIQIYMTFLEEKQRLVILKFLSVTTGEVHHICYPITKSFTVVFILSMAFYQLNLMQL